MQEVRGKKKGGGAKNIDVRDHCKACVSGGGERIQADDPTRKENRCEKGVKGNSIHRYLVRRRERVRVRVREAMVVCQILGGNASCLHQRISQEP